MTILEIRKNLQQRRGTFTYEESLDLLEAIGNIASSIGITPSSLTTGNVTITANNLTPFTINNSSNVLLEQVASSGARTYNYNGTFGTTPIETTKVNTSTTIGEKLSNGAEKWYLKSNVGADIGSINYGTPGLITANKNVGIILASSAALADRFDMVNSQDYFSMGYTVNEYELSAGRFVQTLTIAPGASTGLGRVAIGNVEPITATRVAIYGLTNSSNASYALRVRSLNGTNLIVVRDDVKLGVGTESLTHMLTVAGSFYTPTLVTDANATSISSLELYITSPFLSVFGATGSGQVVGGAATAGGTYDGATQTMIQTMWDALRGFGFLS